MGYTIPVMGLDGSLSNFGIAVATVCPKYKVIVSVEDLILSKTKPDKKLKRAQDDFARFKQHWFAIEEAAAEYDVTVIFGEIPSGAQDARASFAFGGVTAMLGGLATRYQVTTVTPAEVKLASTGSKHADKEDVIGATHKLFPSAPWITGKKANGMGITTSSGLYLTNANEHLADAIATIQAGLKK